MPAMGASMATFLKSSASVKCINPQLNSKLLIKLYFLFHAKITVLNFVFIYQGKGKSLVLPLKPEKTSLTQSLYDSLSGEMC